MRAFVERTHVVVVVAVVVGNIKGGDNEAKAKPNTQF